MSPEELFERALAEQDDPDLDGKALGVLHAQAEEPTFATALRWLASEAWPRRRIALRVLKELGRDRPFKHRALDVLLPRFEAVASEAERRELVSAIGWQHDLRALPVLVSLVADHDVIVRYLVAQHLPGCALQPDGGADPRGVEALLALTRDEDGDVRFYATAAFETDYPELDSDAIRAALDERARDPEDTIRRSAVEALRRR